MSISIDERGDDPSMGSVNHDIQLKKIVLDQSGEVCSSFQIMILSLGMDQFQFFVPSVLL